MTAFHGLRMVKYLLSLKVKWKRKMSSTSNITDVTTKQST